MLFLFGEVQLETVIHILVVCLCLRHGTFLSFDQTGNVFFKLVNVNLILFLSALIFIHHVIAGCEGSLVFFDGILEQFNLLSDVCDDIFLDLNGSGQIAIFFL